MGCHVPWRKPPLSSTQRAWRRRVQDWRRSVVLFELKFCRKEEWVNFTSSEWYDLLWKNTQIQGIQKVRVRRTSTISASFSAHKSTSARFGLPPICVFREGCCFVCVVEWWVHGEFCAISWKVDYGSSKGRYVRRRPNSSYPQEEARRCSSKSFPQNRRTIVVVVICCLMIRMVVVLLWICDWFVSEVLPNILCVCCRRHAILL